MWNERAQVCEDLVEQINDIPAKSLQGLAAKTLAAVWASRSPMADGPEWDHYVEAEVVELIDNAAALAGLNLPGAAS